MLRDSLQHALEAGLEAATQGSAKEGEFAKALLNVDPTNEKACRRLMRARFTAGDVAGALTIYKTLWDLLAEDYDMEPSAETQALVAEIKGAPSLPPSRMVPVFPTEPRRHLSDARHIGPAVDDVPDRSGEAASRDGLPPAPDRFHGALPRMAGDRRAFEEAALGPAGSAGRYELQTNVHQVGDTLQLLLMLRHRDTNVFIWSDGFELNLERWFENQRRVVQRIAIALNVNLSAEQLRRVADRPDVSLGIYDRWLRCQTLIRTFNVKHWENAERQFAEIIQAAPRFVPAYCGLVDLHNTTHIVYPGKLRSREREQQALTLARQAVELDPSNMNAHRSLAWANAMAGQDALAVSHAEMAYELNPSDPWTHFSTALLLAFSGAHERATELVRLADRNGPGAQQDALGLPGRHPLPHRRLRAGDQGLEPTRWTAIARCAPGGRHRSRCSATSKPRPTRRRSSCNRSARAGSAPKPSTTVPSRDGCCISTRSAKPSPGSACATVSRRRACRTPTSTSDGGDVGRW